MDHEHDQDRGVENCQHKDHSRSSCSMGIAMGRLKACKSTILIVFPWLWLDQGNLQNDPEKTWKDLKGPQNIHRLLQHFQMMHSLGCPTLNPDMWPARPSDTTPVEATISWMIVFSLLTCWALLLVDPIEQKGRELRERSVIEVWKKAGEFCDDNFLEKQNHYR